MGNFIYALVICHFFLQTCTVKTDVIERTDMVAKLEEAKARKGWLSVLLGGPVGVSFWLLIFKTLPLTL